MKVICFLILGAFSVSSFAGGGLSAQNIESVAFHQKGFFMYSDGWNDPNNCRVTGQPNAIVLKNSDSNYDKAYSLILAAFMAEKKVSGYSDGCVEHDGKMYNTIRGYKYLSVN